jgi:ABC-type branched-subunit amino acid transport system substrate-binding protein
MHFLKQLLAVAAIAVSTLAGAEPGVTATTITLGMSSPFTGPNGAYGLDMRQVIESYFDQVNKSGGVNGRKVSLLALDDGYETDRTVANTNALINDKKVFALLAYYGSSPTTEAMNKVFGPARVPLVGTISGAGSLREPISQNPGSRYMFGPAMPMKPKPSSTSSCPWASRTSPSSTRTTVSGNRVWMA